MGIRTVAVHRKAAQLQAQARAGRLARCRSWRRDVPGHRIFPACPAGQVAYYALSGGVWELMCARTSSPRPALRLVTHALYTATAPPDTAAQVPYLNTMITVYVHCAKKTVDQRETSLGGSALTVARRTGNTLRVEAGLASLSRRGSNELGSLHGWKCTTSK